MATEENIIVRIRAITEGFAKPIQNISSNVGRMSTGFSKAFGAMSMVGGAVVKVFSALKRALGGFRPEWLSVMFISMMLSQVFSGMVQSVLKLTGLFEFWEGVLATILIPVLMPMLEILFRIFEWFLSLPEPVQNLIGILIIAGTAFFGIVSILSQLILMFSSFGISMGTMMVLLAPFALLLGGVAIALFKFGDETDALADKLVNLIDRGVAFVVGFIERIGSFFEQNQTKILEISNKIMNALLNGLMIIIDKISPFVLLFIDTLKQFFETHKKKLYEVAGKLMDLFIAFAITFLPNVLELGKVILEKILNAIKTNKEILQKAFEEFLGLMENIIIELIPSFIEIGVTIAKAIFKGIAQYGSSLGARAIESAFKGGKFDTSSKNYNPFNIGTPLKNDFIWRPGQPPISISPSDTLVGTKSGFGAGAVSINQNNTFYVADRNEWSRLIEDNNRRLVDDIKRQVKV